MKCLRQPFAGWFVLVAAAMIGTLVIAHGLMRSGPRVTVSFLSGAGLVAGKTKVRYRNVEVGRLESLRVSADARHVYAVLQLDAAGRAIATCGARFWIVRPRLGPRNFSGLLSVISGAYLDVDVDLNSHQVCGAFVGLEAPPVVTSDQRGTHFVLRAASLGSLSSGSPVDFRGVPVGEVLGYSLAAGSRNVLVDVFVNAPFDRFVTPGTRWWQASGIELRLGSGGARVQAESIAAVVAGGVAFEPHGDVSAAAAANGQTFALADNREDAMRNDDGPPAVVRMRFAQSVRGLSVGAPVEFHGVELGTVIAVDIDLNPERDRFDMLVTLQLYPSRLGRSYRNALGDGTGAAAKDLLQQLVARGLRGQLRMGSPLTGQKYVALDLFPRAPAARIDMSRTPLELPSVPNTLEELQDQLSNIVRKLDRMPLQAIGSNLNASLAHSNDLFEHIDGELVPAATAMLASAREAFRSANDTLGQAAPLPRDVDRALIELRRASAGVNALSEYVERHPESFVWGKSADR
ncbi:PqiB family protein [Paraburkholderia acidipaludis]|uniref:PqiB family protein n=1 Tax=Paraburkholderia acidipaludis TaxID=660537 RepID=UPI00048A3367|nr:MlaD family protein [Paraburkholderia acidipaludis]